MHLGGTVATANLGSFERSGGQIKITGTIDNSGRTLSLYGTTGSWLMSGGTLRGGTVSNSAGAQLIFGSGTLDGVTVQAEDGIRNAYVTGVQTCAHPILLNGTLRIGNPTNGWWGV